ncbi:MAG TPA: inorganic diphosphatase [Arsenicitalea sp.]|jgi:inorganic pyrophosphatase|nr:inorganic diphosphatase [Arsenicitalea sp.]
MPITDSNAPARLSQLPALAESGSVNAIIETPKGSRAKFKFDEKLGVMAFDKVLPLGFSFPYDFGFIPSTRGEDGDPLDILLMLDFPLPTGTLIEVKLVGVLEAEQTEDDGKTVRNDRLLGVPAVTSARGEPLTDRIFEEIEAFFIDYDRRFGKEFKPLRRGDAQTALELVKQGQSPA